MERKKMERKKMEKKGRDEMDDMRGQRRGRREGKTYEERNLRRGKYWRVASETDKKTKSL